METKKISRNQRRTLRTASRHWTRFTERAKRYLREPSRTESGLRESRGRRRLGYSLGCRLVHFQLVNVLFFSLPESFPLLLELSLLLAKTRGLYFRFEALFAKLLLLTLKTVVLGLGAGQVVPPVETIALFIALVPGRQYAQDALRCVGSIRSHSYGPSTKQVISDGITPEGTGGKPFACRHDILRKQVLETRTREGEASVKDFVVSR
jgi:hypothetical protein